MGKSSDRDLLQRGWSWEEKVAVILRILHERLEVWMRGYD